MIDNKFIQGILNEFKKDYNLESEVETKAFEFLINYLIITKIIPDAFSTLSDLQELDVDRGSNFGIDGIAILLISH